MSDNLDNFNKNTILIKDWIKESDNGVLLQIHVIPNASKSEISGEHNGKLKIKISSPPVDGSANKELINFFSKKFKISKSKINIKMGEKGRDKTIFIKDAKINSINSILEGA